MVMMNASIERGDRRGTEPEPEAPPPPRVARPKFSPRQAFGVTLGMIRRRRELSQKELATQAGVTEYAITQLENGLSPRNLIIEDLEKIAKVLVCSLEVQDYKTWRPRTTVNTIFTKGGSFKIKARPTPKEGKS